MKSKLGILIVLAVTAMWLATACDSGGGDDGGDDTRVGADTTTPSEDATTPSDDTTTPSDDTTAPSDDTTTPSDDTTAPSDDTTTPPGDTTTQPDQEKIDEALAFCETFWEESGKNPNNCGQPDMTLEHSDCDWTLCNYCYVLETNLQNCEALPDMCIGGTTPAFFPPCDAGIVLCVGEIECENYDKLEGAGFISECQTASTACQESYK